jgi:hypothetical protein
MGHSLPDLQSRGNWELPVAIDLLIMPAKRVAVRMESDRVRDAQRLAVERKVRPAILEVTTETVAHLQPEVKRAAAERWCRAVSADGRFGTWRYFLAFNPGDVPYPAERGPAPERRSRLMTVLGD